MGCEEGEEKNLGNEDDSKIVSVPVYFGLFAIARMNSRVFGFHATPK